MARVLRLCGLKHSLWFMVVRCECDNDVFHALRSWQLKKKGDTFDILEKNKRADVLLLLSSCPLLLAMLSFHFFFFFF